VTRSKTIRNASLVVLAITVGEILRRQQMNPDSPLSRKERESISEFRRRFTQAQAGANEVFAKILRRLNRQGHASGMLGKYLYRALTGILKDETNWVAQDLVEHVETEAGREGE
jgi:hypothetical protein